jgi:hypothetical protein
MDSLHDDARHADREQLARLDSSRGPDFDRLFLTFMIQHHMGAITMVNTLFGSEGAAQDETTFRLASDIYADQTTEIHRMQLMLDALPPENTTMIRSYSRRSLALASCPGLVALGGCASSSSSSGAGTSMATSASRPDPRVGLRAGVMNTAAQAAWNMKLVSNTPPSEKFLGSTNSDMSFSQNYVIQGNYNGYQVWDISNPAAPSLKIGYFCPASQSDVSVYKNLLFVSGEGISGRLDCAATGVQDSVSHDRLRGLRIFDIPTSPIRSTSATCRPAAAPTPTRSWKIPRTRPTCTSTSPVRPVSGLRRSCRAAPGCSRAKDPNSALFRIEVIKVPLAHPEQAAIVNSPRIFNDLVAPPVHSEAPEDIARGRPRRLGPRAWRLSPRRSRARHRPAQRIHQAMLDSIVKARGGTGDPTAADSAALRAACSTSSTSWWAPAPGTIRPGPTQCHDITVYPAIGLAGGACGGYGLLLDISDPANPKRIGAVVRLELLLLALGDVQQRRHQDPLLRRVGRRRAAEVPRDRQAGVGRRRDLHADDRQEDGDAVLLQDAGGADPVENCVAHNGSLIPVPGRDIMVQSWYQGGVSVFDWTDAAHPKEIAFFDRGRSIRPRWAAVGPGRPTGTMGALQLGDLPRPGCLPADAQPDASQNEIDAAKSVHLDYLNVQGQPKLVWPASFAVPAPTWTSSSRSDGMAASSHRFGPERADRAERLCGQARKDALSALATQLHTDATSATDQTKAHALATSVGNLASAQ